MIGGHNDEAESGIRQRIIRIHSDQALPTTECVVDAFLKSEIILKKWNALVALFNYYYSIVFRSTSGYSELIEIREIVFPFNKVYFLE